MGLTLSLSRVSFLPLVRNNIFYEIVTSSTGLYNTGLGAQSTGGGKFGFGFPYLPPLLRKSGSAPVYFEKKL